MKRLLSYAKVIHKSAPYRTLLGLILTVELIFLFHIYSLLPGNSFLAAVVPDVLIDLTNQAREDSGAQKLGFDDKLEQAALLKAKDMAKRGYFSHVGPDGKSPWSWLDEVNYDYVRAGENLAVNFADSADIQEAWMQSTSHRANILNSNFTEIGIATARGEYKGSDAVFVVQFFGSPKLAGAATPSLQQPKRAQINDDSTAQVERQPKIVEDSLPAPERVEIYMETGETAGVSRAKLAEHLVSRPRQLTLFIFVSIAAMATAVFLVRMLRGTYESHELAHAGFVILLALVLVVANEYLVGSNLVVVEAYAY